MVCLPLTSFPNGTANCAYYTFYLQFYIDCVWGEETGKCPLSSSISASSGPLSAFDVETTDSGL